MKNINSKEKLMIIYECDHSGHRVGYLTHIINYVNQDVNCLNKILFVLGDELINKLVNECVDLNYINLHKLVNIYHGNPQRGVLLLKDLNKILEKNPTIEKLVLMNFDLFIYTFLKEGINKKVEIRTIFFRPYIHFPKVSLKNKVQYFIKKNILRFLFLKNKNLSKVFILNDEKGVEELNSTFVKDKVKRFYYLPDPVKVIQSVSCEKSNLNANHISFLIIGTIDEKKNIRNFFNALLRLQETNLEVKIKVTVAGKVANHFKKELYELVYVSKESGIEIDLIDKFLSENEFDDLLNRTDAVFLAYSGFYSSSGILGHSISNLKFFIYSKGGLIEQIGIKYNVGVGCYPENIDSIIFALSEVIRISRSREYIAKYALNRVKYLNEYRPELFVETLLKH